jgi:hypothetical protein
MNPEAVAAIGAATKRETLSRLVNLRLSPTDAERLQRIATEAGTSPTAAARAIVLRSLDAIEAKGAA